VWCADQLLTHYVGGGALAIGHNPDAGACHLKGKLVTQASILFDSVLQVTLGTCNSFMQSIPNTVLSKPSYSMHSALLVALDIAYSTV
jgi:hypothetical protein